MAWAQDEFEQVFHMRYPEVVQFLHAFTGDREVGEDLAQEAFVRLWFRGPVVTPDATYWLFRVARNLALDWRKLECRRNDRQRATRMENEAPAFSDEEVERVRKVVEELPGRSREVLLLREFGGLTYAEISRLVRRKENTVKQDLYRARERLRALWKTKFGVER